MAGEDQQARRSALRICNKLRSAGHEAFFVGGAVRDAICGIIPKEYDIVTSATPAETTQLFRQVVAVGLKFGVVVVVEDGSPVEVATFREEEDYADGRHPKVVRFASAREDVLRRDFTINGLLQHPDTGEIVDCVGGRRDIESKTIRAIGDPKVRFGEDALRMLRAVRFAAELGFSIEPATLAAIKCNSTRISKISGERVGKEITKILLSRSAKKGFRLLAETGLLAEIIPEMLPLRGCRQPEQYHPEGDVWEHTLLVLGEIDKTANVSPALALSGLLHDIGKPPMATVTAEGRIHFYGHNVVGARLAEAIAARLRFGAGTRKLVRELVEKHMHFINVQSMNTSNLKKFLRAENFPLLLELHRWDASASNGDMGNYVYCQNALQRMGEDDLHPIKIIKGNDLLALGIPHGPVLGEILSRVEEGQLEGTIRSRAEALEMARQIWGKA